MTDLGLRRARMRGRAERLPRPHTGSRISAGTVLAPLGAFIALIMLWQAVAAAELVPSDILPAPTRVVGAAAAEREALLRHTAPTLLATLLGFALSVTVAFVTATDRKSTRLNSSHVAISYAVFCLTKKKTQSDPRTIHNIASTLI